jgi:hypothetical protein
VDESDVVVKGDDGLAHVGEMLEAVLGKVDPFRGDWKAFLPLEILVVKQTQVGRICQ